jgi:drug/metabolite transporter (DMT)-like permease
MPPARPRWKTRLFAAIVILSNTLGNFFIARGMRGLAVPADSPLRLIQAIFTPWVALGVTLLIVWLLSRITLLSWADLSYVLPITSLGYVANALMGHFFLGEHVTLARWGGTLLIVAGTVLVGMGTHTTAAQSAPNAPSQDHA